MTSELLKKDIQFIEKKIQSTARLEEICRNLEKCDINEIAKYLTNLSKKIS